MDRDPGSPALGARLTPAAVVRARTSRQRLALSPCAVLLAALLALALCRVAAANPLRVGVAGPPPWLLPETHASLSASPAPNAASSSTPLSGFSVQLWQAVATKLNRPYQLVALPTIDDQMKQLVAGNLDVAIGPVAVTADRARQLSFTQPYFASTLAMLTYRHPPTPWERLRPFVSAAFAALVGGLLLVLFAVSNVVWLAERDENPKIPREWREGIGQAMWLALVTMTTVGYGDRVPVTRAGRITMGLWMMLATVLTSTLTAGLTTALTVSNLGTSAIKSFDALNGLPVASLRDTVAQGFAQSCRAHVLATDTLDQAIAALLAHRVDAVVYDDPSLRYFLQKNPNPALTIVDATAQGETFCYALPLNSPLQQDLNVALLALIEQGTVRQLRDEWFDFGTGEPPIPGAILPATSPPPGASPHSTPQGELRPSGVPTP